MFRVRHCLVLRFQYHFSPVTHVPRWTSLGVSELVPIVGFRATLGGAERGLKGN